MYIKKREREEERERKEEEEKELCDEISCRPMKGKT